MEDTKPNPPTPIGGGVVTLEQYQYALAQLLFHQAKVDQYIKITRAYNYQIEKKV